MDIKLDEHFDKFMELYKNDKIYFSFRKNSYVMEINQKIDKREDFSKFINNLVNGLRQKVLEKEIDDTYKEYQEYIDKLLKYDPEIKDDIITRCKSNINICNNIDYEILTKRNQQLEPECYSVLINLNLEKPYDGNELQKQVNFELSIKDLKAFYKILGEALNKIEKLNEKELG